MPFHSLFSPSIFRISFLLLVCTNSLEGVNYLAICNRCFFSCTSDTERNAFQKVVFDHSEFEGFFRSGVVEPFVLRFDPFFWPCANQPNLRRHCDKKVPNLSFQTSEGSEGWESWEGWEGSEGREGSEGWEGWEGWKGWRGSEGWNGWEGWEGWEGWSGWDGSEGSEGWDRWLRRLRKLRRLSVEDEKVGKTSRWALKHTYTINYMPCADKRSHDYWALWCFILFVNWDFWNNAVQSTRCCLRGEERVHEHIVEGDACSRRCYCGRVQKGQLPQQLLEQDSTSPTTCSYRTFCVSCRITTHIDNHSQANDLNLLRTNIHTVLHSCTWLRTLHWHAFTRSHIRTSRVAHVHDMTTVHNFEVRWKTWSR